MKSLQDFTTARVALGRAGNSVLTRALLDFQLAHARARDAVHFPLDIRSLLADLEGLKYPCVAAGSAAPDRATFLRRPDLGRQLKEQSKTVLRPLAGEFDAVFLAADGLSALAIHRHAPRMLEILHPLLKPDQWRIGPLVVITQGRVAIGDEIGLLLGAAMTVMLIGERPGLSSPDSLGVYVTWNPRPGATDADRNCISNIRAEGLGYAAAAHRLLFLMTEGRRRKLTGIRLKEDARLLL